MFRQKLQNFMMGRYGTDQLNIFLTVSALLLTILAMISGWAVLSSIGTIFLVVSIFRTYSKNISARYQENLKFLPYWRKISNIFSRIKRWFQQKQQQWKDRKTHCYFSCPSCHQTLRVPKGKGKIKISCPKCKTEIIKKT